LGAALVRKARRRRVPLLTAPRTERVLVEVIELARPPAAYRSLPARDYLINGPSVLYPLEDYKRYEKLVRSRKHRAAADPIPAGTS
jgi:hypothetical protein